MEEAVDLGARFGPVFSATNLRQMRAFHLAWPPERIQQTLSAESSRGHNDPATRVSALAEAFPLPWSSYARLLRVSPVAARAFYEREAIHGGWSARQLRRQNYSQFYERAALSHDKVNVLKGAQDARSQLTSPPCHSGPLRARIT